VQSQAAITVRRDRAEVERLWRDPQFHQTEVKDAQVRFVAAPGDRGTEIHVDLGDEAPSGLTGLAQKVQGGDPLAKAKDDLRRFKALVETGEIPRSDAVPEGELAERKLRQRPAQPLDQPQHAEV
jgi:hypothetical protein